MLGSLRYVGKLKLTSVDDSTTGTFIVSRSQPNRMKIVISLAGPEHFAPNHTWKSHGNRVACGHMFSEQNCSSMFRYGL